MLWSIALPPKIAFVFTILVILFQNKAKCRKSSLDVTNPETWKKLADQKFEKFKKTYAYSTVKRPKNVILFLGDGMSMSTVTGARYLKAEKMNLLGGDVELAWEEWPVASLVRTFNSDRLTTDSGSAATAFLSGAKGSFETVGVTGNVSCCQCTELKEVERAKSSLHYATKAGLSTGIVTTTRVTHATPAASYANILFRDWEGNGATNDKGYKCVDAAAQLLTNGSDINVVMGGGASVFYGSNESLAFQAKGRRSDFRNLLQEWRQIQTQKQRKHAVLHTTKEFKDTDWSSVDFVLGLFAPNHLDYYINNADQPTLADMTEAAIKVLSRNPKGFLLLVEGGRIDHGHHTSQAQYALTETLEMEKAVERALSLVNPSETLLMVTADHAHVYGVVGYPTRSTSIFDVDSTKKGNDNKSYLISSYFNGPGGLLDKPRTDPATEERFEPSYIAQSLVNVSFGTHSAEDVPIYALGPYSELFHSPCDNTFIAHATMYSLCVGPYADEAHCSSGRNGSHRSLFQMKYYLIFLSLILYYFLH
ncbi:unnamed protein product [Trichobilharzia szidati]|nr:unnamed protein product [Trichobilharzia szidati]